MLVQKEERSRSPKGSLFLVSTDLGWERWVDRSVDRVTVEIDTELGLYKRKGLLVIPTAEGGSYSEPDSPFVFGEEKEDAISFGKKSS